MNDQPITSDSSEKPLTMPPAAPEPASAPAAPLAPADDGMIEAAEVLEGEVTPAAYDAEPEFTWQASEYVHHHKSAGWYAGLVIPVVIAIVVAVVFKQWVSIGLVLAMGASVAVYAHRPPRILTYKVDSHSVTIEEKAYPYANFRSFGVLSETDWHSIELEPNKRFMPRITLLFGDNDYDTIVEHLSIHLPREDRDPDLVERLTRFLRF